MTKKPLVLVVEDEFIVAFELKMALEEMGYEVCGIENCGESAIEAVGRLQPDCVLMDVTLKGEMDGIEAARDIRARYGVRAAFLSGYPSDEMTARVADLRPIGCFVKPLDYAQLEAALEAFFLGGETTDG
jgi:DNA-binding NarL/FixJ family response regulator